MVSVERVFTQHPLGFVHPYYLDYAYLLRKAIYGLKQAPRAWFSRLSTKLLQLGFVASKADSYLVFIWTPTYCTFILIYVDDIILTGSSSSTIDDLLVQLCMEFVVKDLGPLHYFLGVVVTLVPNGLMLSQQCHIYKSIKTLKKCHLLKK